MADRTKVARILTKSLQELQSRSTAQNPPPPEGGNLRHDVILTLADKGPLTFDELLSQVAVNSTTSLALAVSKLNENHLITDQEPADGRLRLTERGRDLALTLQLA